MKPLNQKERNNLFFQFLVFYVASIIVVLFAAFGNVQMNQQQNEKLNSDINKLKKEVSASDDFFMHMGKVEGIISRVTNSDQAIHLDEAFQKEKRVLSQLADQQDSLRVNYLGWYNIINGYNLRWEDKKNMTDQDKLVQSIKEKDAKIEQMTKDYAKLDRDFSTYVKTHN
ncbi:MAG: hypothetical protein IPO83_18045 [Chitinophagaceae bacterium]|nr:hypothetical protein [Chitinophagaceae bacterium]